MDANAVFLIAAVSIFLVAGALVMATVAVLRPRMHLRRRMAAYGLASGSESLAGRAGNPRQKRIQEKLQELEDKKKTQRRRNQIRANLLQAGIDTSVRNYIIAAIAAGVVLAGLGFLFRLPLAAVIGAGLFGAFLLPKLVLRFMAKRRQKKFTSEFANAIDVLVRGIKSGLPVGECLNIIGREAPDPVGEEFRLLVEGQKLGLAMDELLARGLERIPTAEFKFFAIVLQIQQKTGGNLAATLSNLSTVLRERKKMKDKVQALSSEAKSSAMIIGSLPFFVSGLISIINPAYMSLLLTTTAGHYMIAGGLLWMGLGVLVMRKMINFEM